MESEKRNQIQVSTRKDVKFFTFLAKIFLKEFQEIELHALGDAISQAVKVAETLERYNYAKITKINQGLQDSEGRKKVKIVIVLAKSSGDMLE